MQERAKFIQLFRYELSEPDHDSFERIIINAKYIHMVEWHENWDFVAIVCHTDHPEGIETCIEDYGNPIAARNRYMHLLTLLGANDGTAFEREKLMKKTMKEHAKTDKWFHDLFQKAKAAGYDPFNDDEPESSTVDSGKEEEASECEGCKGNVQECCDSCGYDGACNRPSETIDQEQAEVSEDGSDTPAEPEGHMG